MTKKTDEFDKMISDFMKKKQTTVFNPDVLDREEVIKNISDIINQSILSQEPISLALTGTWGVGKTYILNKIEKKFYGKCMVIHYDCWKNDYHEEPLVGILSTIAGQLNAVESKNPDKNQAEYYAEMLKIISKMALFAANPQAQSLIKGIRDVYGVINNLVKGKKDKEIKPFGSLTGISDLIDVINSLLCGYMLYESKKIIFVVDEMDRCLPDYAIKVLNRLHHICNETPLIQIVSINDEELKRNINGIYRRGEDDSFAKNYLQRFFTNSYRISNGTSKELIKHYWSDINNYFFIKDKEFLYSFFDTILQKFVIREKINAIKTLRLYHKSTLGITKEKYPFELVCAELLEILKRILGIQEEWIVSNGAIHEVGMTAIVSLNFRPHPLAETSYLQIFVDLSKKVKMQDRLSNITLDRVGFTHDFKNIHPYNIFTYTSVEIISAFLTSKKNLQFSDDGQSITITREDFSKAYDFFLAFKQKVNDYV